MPKTLFDISDDLLEAYALLEDIEGDVTDLCTCGHLKTDYSNNDDNGHVQNMCVEEEIYYCLQCDCKEFIFFESAINEFFDSAFDSLEIKLDNYAALITEFKKRAKVRKEESDRLAKLSKAEDNAADWLKRRLLTYFKLHNLKKIETQRYRILRVNNGGVLPVILSEKMKKNPQDLPTQFQRVKIEPDIDKIREILLEDNLLWATLGERGEHIRIK